MGLPFWLPCKSNVSLLVTDVKKKIHFFNFLFVNIEMVKVGNILFLSIRRSNMIDGISCYYILFLLHGIYTATKARTPLNVVSFTLLLELPVIGRMFNVW